MKASENPSTDAEELLALSCLRPEAAPHFISLVQRAPAALQLVRTNPVLFSLIAFQVSQTRLSDEEVTELLGRKKRELSAWLGGVDQEASVKFIERFEVPASVGDFERTLRRIADEELLHESVSRPLSEVFQARRYFESSPELREFSAFKAELREASRTIGPPAARRLISEVRDLGELLEKNVEGDLVGCSNGAALDELRQRLIAEAYELAPTRLKELPGYPRTFPRASVVLLSTIIPIVDEHELHSEAHEMNHCVATMVHEFLVGEAFLFRVLQPERATLKVRKKGHRLVLEELKLADNEEPSVATYGVVERWLDGAAGPAPQSGS